MIFKAYYYRIDQETYKEVPETLLVPCENLEHAERIVRAYEKTAFSLRFETMPSAQP